MHSNAPLFERLRPTEHDTKACIRIRVKNILATRLLVGGLACHFAPTAQPPRAPYGYGEIIGIPFEYRSGRRAQVYLVAPALEFAKPTHGPHEPFSESQLCAHTTGRSQTCSIPHLYTAVSLSANGPSQCHPLLRIPGLPLQRWTPPQTHDDQRPHIQHDRRMPSFCGNITESPISPPPAAR